MIIKILVCHPDGVFVEFLRRYLDVYGFDIKVTTDCVEGITQLIHFKPHLVVVNKEFKGIDAKGFLTKKNATQVSAQIPVFLIGTFTSREIMELKTMNARAFISNPVNPVILVERVMNLFSLPLPTVKKTMPMLMDINARGNIIIAQLEGNFEPEKLELFNYYLRSYCVEKKIKAPRLLLIIPSLYPETVTESNIARLFRFLTYPELTVEPHGVKILTGVSELKELLETSADYKRFEIATDFLSALQTLQIDFDKKKTVPAEFIKKGSIYIFDLYDSSGKRVIPAHTPVSEKIIGFLTEQG
ncbi:MAG TPA: hypothetical protein ENN69_07070, partial [Spirochaetia bacterium]|nr:hypothetical protein [Spirochaetia bacterium]